jgi:hypothetical protein
MKVRTLAELASVDVTTKRFTPLGLSTRYVLTDEACAQFVQERVARYELVDSIPEDLRKIFGRLQGVHTFGVFEYDLFTVAEAFAFLTFEGALRARFVDAYRGVIPFVDKLSGTEETVAVKSFDDVFAVVRRGGRYADAKRWQLRRVQSQAGVHPTFRGSFGSLRAWARREGFLSGQQSRVVESRAIENLRNFIAHPERYHRTMPGDSARAIGDVAEFINRLWGHRTPGGHLYPAPVGRVPCAVARTVTGTTALRLEVQDVLDLAANPNAPEWKSDSVPLHRTAEWNFRWVRCPTVLDPLDYEMTGDWARAPLPIDLLWGPGDLEGAVAAWNIKSAEWGADTVDTTDRVFLVRIRAGRDPEWPLSPSVARALADDGMQATWYVLTADVPGDAVDHVQKLVSGPHTRDAELCDDCRVHFHGHFTTRAEALRKADAVG